jgi:hypothetical protein
MNAFVEGLKRVRDATAARLAAAVASVTAAPLAAVSLNGAVEPKPRRANTAEVRRGTPPAKPTPPPAPPQSWPLLYVVGGTRGGVNINSEFRDTPATETWRRQNGGG